MEYQWLHIFTPVKVWLLYETPTLHPPSILISHPHPYTFIHCTMDSKLLSSLDFMGGKWLMFPPHDPAPPHYTVPQPLPSLLYVSPKTWKYPSMESLAITHTDRTMTCTKIQVNWIPKAELCNTIKLMSYWFLLNRKSWQVKTDCGGCLLESNRTQVQA